MSNPERTHPVQSFADRFTDLPLPSYLYVGMQQISLGADVGFDLSREYTAAMALFTGVGAL